MRDGKNADDAGRRPFVLGLIQAEGRTGDARLTLYSRGKRLAVIVGGDEYLSRALAASGLSPPVASLAKDRDRPGVALVRREPADRNAKSSG
jgi:hypothetical protein